MRMLVNSVSLAGYKDHAHPEERGTTSTNKLLHDETLLREKLRKRVLGPEFDMPPVQKTVW